MADRASSYKYIDNNDTYQVKSGRGRLRRLTFSTPVSGSTVTVYDETGIGTAKIIAIVTNTTDVKPYFLDYNIIFHTGLKIVTSGDDKITVSYE